MDLSNLAKKLYQMGEDLHEGLADGIQKTANRVSSNAKKRLGHYQNNWRILKDKTIQRKIGKSKTATVKRLYGYVSANGKKVSRRDLGDMYETGQAQKLLHATGTDTDAPLVDDGLLRGSITVSMDRRRLTAEVGSPMEHAAAQEFGREEINLPARPYLRPALNEEVKAHLKDDLAEGVARRVRR